MRAQAFFGLTILSTLLVTFPLKQSPYAQDEKPKIGFSIEAMKGERWQTVAGCSGAVAQRNRIAERAHQGIRRADGGNRQGSVPGSVLAQASVGCRNADGADVCADDGRSVSIPKVAR
jgi:hypothetical protein